MFVTDHACGAKCVLHCNWKFIGCSGLEHGLVESDVFGQKVESVISATNYSRSLKGVLIIESSIELINGMPSEMKERYQNLMKQ